MIAQRSSPAANRRGLTFWTHWLAAIGTACALLHGLANAVLGEFTAQYQALILVTLLGSIPIYSALRVFHKRLGYVTGLLRLLFAWLVLLLAVLTFSTLSGYPPVNTDLMLEWAVYGLLVQAATFLPLRYFATHHARTLREERASIIIGEGEIAQTLASRLRHRVPLLGLVTLAPSSARDISGFAVIGHVAQLREVIASAHVRRVYIALSLKHYTLIEHLYIELLDQCVDVVWVPDLSSMMLLNQSISQIEQMPAIYLNETHRSSHPAAIFGKEVIDRVIAFTALLVLLPMFLCIAAAVKLSSPGPVFFRQPRHGWNGEVINVWKFRSMRLHDEDEVTQQAQRGDARVTAVGRFIRKTSIDELPQLINVLLGEMALVGPRPHAVSHNQYYSDKILAYMARHRVKPGITGLAQVSGLRGETQTLEKMARRVEKDLEYINHWSLWLDLKILIKTPFTLFSRDIY